MKRKRNRKVENLVGKKFNKLTVISRADDYYLSNGNRFVRWLCKCDCGNEVIVRGTSLRNGHTKSCGCIRSESVIGLNQKDLTGKIFGRWTVLYKNGRVKEPRGKYVPLWHCRCQCGVERDIRTGSLTSGASLSCGCYKYEKLKEIASKGTRSSNLELFVKEFLDINKIKYDVQIIYPDLCSISGYPLSYDFLVYKNDCPFLLIECQGKQHYEPIEYFGGEKQFLIQKQNDFLKKDYAKNIGVNFLEVPYFLCEDDIFKMLDDYLKNI